MSVPLLVTLIEGAVVNRHQMLALGAPGGTDIIAGVATVLRDVCGAGFIGSELQLHTDKPRVVGKNQQNITGSCQPHLYHCVSYTLSLMEHYS